MEPFAFELTQGNLNTNFKSIKNCRVVNPPYEKDGYYSDKFFLDKRYGLKLFKNISGDPVDYVEINGYTYFLIHNYAYGTASIYCLDDSNNLIDILSSYGSLYIDSNSPKKIVLGKGIVGTINSTPRQVISPEEGTAGGEDYWDLIPNYAGGYIKFQYTGVQNIEIGDYIMWRGGALKGGINQVQYVDTSTGYVYIIGTNSRGTIPTSDTYFDVYKQKDGSGNIITIESNSILVGTNNGLFLITVNGYEQASVLKVLDTGTSNPIIDVVSFDGNIFALTESNMYFSRTTYEDNTQFYPLDRFSVIGGKKLFPIGKVMMLFRKTNKLYAPVTSSSSSDDNLYAGYDVNYQGDIFSKYSMIFDDQTIYVLQKDKQLKKIDITPYNNTAYDFSVSDVLITTKGLFNNINSDGEVYINSNQRFLNFLYVYNGETINYQYDKMYQHFIENKYSFKIYKYSDYILSPLSIYTEGGYNDNGEEYSQEVNFTIDTNLYIYKPYILRTIFGLTDTEFDINLEVLFELGGRLDTIYKKLNNFIFDNRLSETITGDELLENTTIDEQTKYNGNIVSIQSNLMKVGRFIRFKYSSYNRFIIGNSYVIADKTKIFINEPLLTN